MPENPILEASLSRISTAIKPQSDVIKDFVTTKTFLRGRPFSTKNHEYQDLLMEELVNPNTQFVIYKVSQAGVSEIILRVLAAYCATIPGFSSSIVYPSLEMAREFMRVRFGGIIESSPTLTNLMDPHIDSSTLKRFQNGSIVYALSGSGTSRSTTISRSLTMLIADELQFISMKTLTAMASRQRHQENKATIYFS